MNDVNKTHETKEKVNAFLRIKLLNIIKLNLEDSNLRRIITLHEHLFSEKIKIKEDFPLI